MADHQPYIPASQAPAELTARALVLGVLLGLIFSASSVYLALKIGLTVSSSIPIAVLSIAGGLMGILMMIPLRRALIVKEHDTLIYPEGTACAEVLIAGEERGLQAKRVFQAFGVGFVYKFLQAGLKFWPDVPGKALGFYPGAAVFTEASPELLGVGYIIGPRIAGYLFAGGCLAYLVLAPAIKLVGSGLTEPFGFPAVKLIRDMSPGEIRASFVFYIGAGAVASAGIIALARSLPTILSSFASSLKDLRDSRLGQAVTRLRTEDDLPISLTVGGSIALAIVLTLLPQVGVNLLGAILVGALGSALVVGWTLTLLNRAYTYPVPETHPAFSAQAVAPAAGGGRAAVEVLPETMSGFRIAASDSVDPASYQVVRVYVVTEGVAAGKYLMDPATHELRYVVDPGIGGRIHEYHGKTIPRLDSPKATIMALIADGILTHKLPWVLVLLGVFLTIAIELMGVQALPVAVGVYLPISTSSAMFAGGVVRWLIERRAQARQQSIAEVESGPGVLFASGLIAGGAICGIVLAAIAGVLGSADALAEKAPLFRALGDIAHSNLLAYGLFLGLGVLLYRIGLRQH